MAQIKFKYINDTVTGDAFTVVLKSEYKAKSTLYEYQVEVRALLSAAI